MLSSALRHARLDGFELRPPVAQERLRLLGDGRVLLMLKTAWADGTRYPRFEPLELLKKLAALTPRPRINLVLSHGVLAPLRGGARGGLRRYLPDSSAEDPPAERMHRQVNPRPQESSTWRLFVR